MLQRYASLTQEKNENIFVFRANIVGILCTKQVSIIKGNILYRVYFISAKGKII